MSVAVQKGATEMRATPAQRIDSLPARARVIFALLPFPYALSMFLALESQNAGRVGQG